MAHRRAFVSFAAVLAILAAAFPSSAAPTAGVNWQPSFEEAKLLAAQSNRLILVHFWAPSCKECKKLDHDVFAQATVQQSINARFIPVKLNTDDYPTTAKMYGVDRLPTDLIITPAGQIVGRMKCPTNAKEYLDQLNIAASGTAQPANTAAAQSAAPSLANNPFAPAQPAAPQNYYPAQQAAGALPVASPYPTSAYPSTAAPTAASLYPTATSAGYPYAGASPAIAPSAVTPAQSPAAPAMPNYSDQRYNEYFQRFGSPAQNNTAQTTSNPYAQPAANYPAQPAAGYTAQPAASYTAQPAASNPAQPGYTQPTYPQTAVNQPVYPQAQPAASYPAQPASSYPVAPAASTPGAVGWPSNAANPTALVHNPSPTSPAPSASITGVAAAAPTQAPAIAPAVSQFGLDGYCPVTLAEQKRWQVGDRRFGAMHRGKTYLFAGPVEQQKFLASPDRYAPAISGEDVVAAVDQGQSVPGKREFGVEFQGRTYLFASPASRQIFCQNSQRYVAEVLQAENTRPPLR